MSAPAVNIFEWMRSVQADPDLTLADRLIASHLALYVDRESGECFPSMETLADGVRVDVRTVRRAIAALRKAGWLWCRRESRRQSFIYQMTLACRFPRPEDGFIAAPNEAAAQVRSPAPGPDTDVRSEGLRQDTDVRSHDARPDTGVRRDRTRVSSYLLSDPKKDPPKPPTPRSTINEGKGLSGRVHVAVDDPRWAACASAYRRKRGVGPPTATITVDGQPRQGWSFDRSLIELAEISASYRYPYAEAAE